MTAPSRTDWHLDAACQGADPTWFAPDRPLHESEYAIRRWCEAPCPVIEQCAREAEALRDWGVRGGRLRVNQASAAVQRRAYTADDLDKGYGLPGGPRTGGGKARHAVRKAGS